MNVTPRLVLVTLVAWSVATVSLAASDREEEAERKTPFRLVEIDRGDSWVSPYWGYSTPKVVFDGTTYYTVGLWGTEPDSAHGMVYAFDADGVRKGRQLEGIYQPATVALDEQGRLVVAYTRRNAPAAILRSREPGGIDVFDELPPPPDMPDAYYIGIAIRGQTFYLAYLAGSTYTMYLARLDLDALVWSLSTVVREGQIRRKPKTAWTYPILFPDERGLHLVASNCPDGGDGNTYNQVRYQFYPDGAIESATNEIVAECPVGHIAYAMDMLVDSEGAVHVLFMWNQRRYGAPLPVKAPVEGTYHGMRNPATGEWERRLVSPLSIASLHWERPRSSAEQARLYALTYQRGTIIPYERRRIEPEPEPDFEFDKEVELDGDDQSKLSVRPLPEERAEPIEWIELPELFAQEDVPSGSGFLDVLGPASGSKLDKGLALVADGMAQNSDGDAMERVIWALIPDPLLRP